MRSTDEAEFIAYAESARGRLRQVAYLLCGDWHRAEDATQEVLIRLYRRWSKVERREGLLPYARAIDSVDRVEVRVGTPDDPAPWRWAPVRDGWVYWGAWFADGTYDADDEVWLEWRAFDTSGKRIDDQRLPILRHRLPMSPGEPYDPPGWGS